MVDDLIFSAIVGASVTVASALVIGLARRLGWIGPLMDADSRRSMVVRLPTALLWVTAVVFGAMALVDFLEPSMGWVATGLGWALGVALGALGIGVAFL